MSRLEHEKTLITNYTELYKRTIKLLKILITIPNKQITNEEDYKFINRAIEILTNFLELKTITQIDIKTVQEIIKVANPEMIFSCYTQEIDVNYCNTEFLKYLNDPINYKIPNLETFIDNGEFLKLYIEYKIEEHNEQKFKDKQENDIEICKSI